MAASGTIRSLSPPGILKQKNPNPMSSKCRVIIQTYEVMFVGVA